jgi:type IV secretion system protein VirB5
MKVCKLKRRQVVMAVMVTFAGGIITPPAIAITVHDPISNMRRVAEAVKQMNEYVKQYQVILGQLKQAQEAYKAITGIRSVGGLFMALNDRLVYNSLPLEAQLLVGDTDRLLGAFSALQRNIDAAKRKTSMLTDDSFKNNPYGKATWEQTVRTIGAQYGVGETVYHDSTVRVRKLEDLIRAIGTAGDPKAIADLNARISGEQTMLQNQMIQLQALQMMQEAERRQIEQRSVDLLMKAGDLGIPKLVFPKLFE